MKKNNLFAQQGQATVIALILALLLYLAGYQPDLYWQPYVFLVALWLAVMLFLNLRHHVRSNIKDEQREFLLDTLANAAPVILWHVDGEGVVRDIRGSALAHAGICGQSLMGKNMATVAGTNQGLLADMRRALSGERFVSHQLLGKRYYRHHYYPIIGRGGGLEGFNCVSVDLSRERELAAELQLSQQVFEHTTDAIVIGDERRRVISANEAFTRITGFTQDEVKGRKVGLPRASGQSIGFYRELAQTLAAQDCWHGEVWGRRKSGELFTAKLTLSRVREKDAVTNYIAFFSDVTDIKRTQEELQYLANHDNLTGLPNRRLFLDRLDQAIKRAKRLHQRMAIYYVDLDNFKMINDSLGHQFGDELLKSVAERLRDIVRESDTVARLAGDEFTVIAENVRDNGEVVSIARKILSSFEAPFEAYGEELEASASVGVGIYPDDGEDLLSLMKNADAAMYKAKAHGRNGYYYLAEDGSGQLPDKVFFPSELRLAIKREQLELVYQPLVDLNTGSIFGCEALLRWNHHCRGQLMPNDFLSMAEEKGIISQIGTWVADRACSQYQLWSEQGLVLDHLSINVAAVQLDDPDFLDNLMRSVERSGAASRSLILEIPEKVVLSNLEKSRLIMRIAAQKGIGCVINDFGSSADDFGYLKTLPVQMIKLDQRFVNTIKHGREGQLLVKALSTIAELLDIRVVAVGIERPNQEQFIRSMGCQLGQGYLYAKPMTADSFLKFYAASQGALAQQWQIG